MQTEIKKQNLIFSGIIAIFLAVFVFVPVFVGAAGIDDTISGLKQTADKGLGGGEGDANANLEEKNVITSIPVMIGKAVGAVLAFLGVIFLLLMIYGGITWMIARGNEQAVQKAKDIMEAAIIGLVITLAAYAITAFIGGQLAPTT